VLPDASSILATSTITKNDGPGVGPFFFLRRIPAHVAAGDFMPSPVFHAFAVASLKTADFSCGKMSHEWQNGRRRAAVFLKIYAGIR